jgi:hypothetical protein
MTKTRFLLGIFNLLLQVLFRLLAGIITLGATVLEHSRT